MSALFFGLFGVFSLTLLVWILKSQRTPSRGIWQPSVTASEDPAKYWQQVLFVGIVVVTAGYFTATAVQQL